MVGALPGLLIAKATAPEAVNEVKASRAARHAAGLPHSEFASPLPFLFPMKYVPAAPLWLKCFSTFPFC